MRKIIASVAVALFLAGAALAHPGPAPRQEWPARFSQAATMQQLEEEAAKLERAAQTIFDEAFVDGVEKHNVPATREARQRMRWDRQARVFYLEPEVAPQSSAIAPVSSQRP